MNDKDQDPTPAPSSPASGHGTDLMEMLFDRMPMGIAIFDRQYRIQRYNTTWEGYATRYAPPTAAPLAPGVYYFDCFPGAESHSIPMFESVLSGETIRLDGGRFEAGDMVSYWDAVLTPLLEDGEVNGILNVTIDATERDKVFSPCLIQPQYDFDIRIITQMKSSVFDFLSEC